MFGNAYFALCGCAPDGDQSIVGEPGGGFLRPEPDPSRNELLLRGVAAVVGGIETVALQAVIPRIVMLAERWEHRALRGLIAQIRDIVRPEESRHVLIWRYVFHRLVAPKGHDAIARYLRATNDGRRTVGASDLDRESFSRLVGSRAPSPRQLLGKERGSA